MATTTTGFFRPPREVRDMVDEYLWQSKPNVIIQHGTVELRASYRRFRHTEDKRLFPYFRMIAQGWNSPLPLSLSNMDFQHGCSPTNKS
jgi:hypothetical protein